MNLEAVGIIINGVSALGVIGTLFYVAAQIRQSTAQARRAEKNANLEHSSLFRLALAENQDLAEIWRRGLENCESLDRTEIIRFDALMTQTFWTWVHIHDRITKGSSGENWANGQYQIRELLAWPGARMWWSKTKERFPSEFAEEVTPLLQSDPMPSITMKADT